MPVDKQLDHQLKEWNRQLQMHQQLKQQELQLLQQQQQQLQQRLALVLDVGANRLVPALQSGAAGKSQHTSRSGLKQTLRTGQQQLQVPDQYQNHQQQQQQQQQLLPLSGQQANANRDAEAPHAMLPLNQQQLLHSCQKDPMACNAPGTVGRPQQELQLTPWMCDAHCRDVIDMCASDDATMQDGRPAGSQRPAVVLLPVQAPKQASESACQVAQQATMETARSQPICQPDTSAAPQQVGAMQETGGAPQTTAAEITLATTAVPSGDAVPVRLANTVTGAATAVQQAQPAEPSKQSAITAPSCDLSCQSISAAPALSTGNLQSAAPLNAPTAALPGMSDALSGQRSVVTEAALVAVEHGSAVPAAASAGCLDFSAGTSLLPPSEVRELALSPCCAALFKGVIFQACIRLLGDVSSSMQLHLANIAAQHMLVLSLTSSIVAVCHLLVMGGIPLQYCTQLQHQ